MTIRLALLTPAPGPAVRGARIDDTGPLDEEGRRRARAAADDLPRADRLRRVLPGGAPSGGQPLASPS